MGAYLRLARLYFVLLVLFTVGRWLQGTFGVPYVKAHQVFSIVILTLLSSVFYGAFCRRWLGYRVAQAMALAAILAVTSQLVILLATAASYGLGLETYFNHSTALNVTQLGDVTASGEPSRVAVPFGEAMGRRLAGLVFNPITCGIAGAIGWALGGLLPAAPGSAISKAETHDV